MCIIYRKKKYRVENKIDIQFQAVEYKKVIQYEIYIIA